MAVRSQIDHIERLQVGLNRIFYDQFMKAIFRRNIILPLFVTYL